MTLNSSSPDVAFYFESDASMARPKRLKHSTAALFHVIFKIIAVFIYLFGGFFGQGFLGIFVEIILLISIDFWVVKNITGRLLAGLRWWNYIDEEGNSHWIFENKHSKENQNDHLNFINDQDGNAGVFWIALILTPIVWFLLLLVSLFRLNFHWFMVVALALVLSSSNLYGYVRCKMGSKDIKTSLTQFVGKKLFFKYLSSTSSSSASKMPQNPIYPSA